MKPSEQVLGGPSSAFARVPPPVAAVTPDDQVDSIRRLLDRVEEQKRELELAGTVDTAKLNATLFILCILGTATGAGTGQKDDAADRAFVARVLGIPEESLARQEKTFEEGESTLVELRIGLEEETLASERVTATRRRMYLEASSTSGSTSSSPSNTTDGSSDLLSKEKFLSHPLQGPMGQVMTYHDQSSKKEVHRFFFI